MSIVSTLPSSTDHLNSSFITAHKVDGINDGDEHHAEEVLTSALAALAPDNLSSNSMDRSTSEYSQPGLQYPNASSAQTTEDITADQPSAAHFAPQDARTNGYQTSATPSSTEYGGHPTSARSGTFPEHIQRQYYPSSNHSGSSGSMAQPTSPSMPQQDARNDHPTVVQQGKSDAEVPIDPSIAASSPTYPQQYGQQPQQSPYPPHHDMTHGYPHQHGGPMYAQPRPDWAGYGGQHPGMQTPYPTSGVQTPTSAAPAGGRPGQVYSFVPIPGAQQHKRPRRRYEEIERMYKCGWNGCEKAYGTLNHLNAHVTMQSHGQKRTPEEFKEIRKEWKARKKEEDNARKADEERARAAQSQGGPDGGADGQPPAGYQQGGRSVQLPPIGYQPGAQVQGQYQAPPGGVQQLQEYGQSHMYSGYPASPYGSAQMYGQHNGAPYKPEH